LRFLLLSMIVFNHAINLSPDIITYSGL